MNIIPFFPNPFSLSDYDNIIADENRDLSPDKLGFTSKYQFVNTGSAGIYLLLKSYNLTKNSKVGLPALICNSVSLAIQKAGLKPYFFDINDEFQLKFEEESFNKAGIKALILPHFYGSIYPKTDQVIEWCKNKSVYLINDVAQSFNLIFEGKPLIEIGDGGIYSFGAGKSLNCAGGAIVYGLNNPIEYHENFILKYLSLRISKKFLKSRIVEANKIKIQILKKLFDSFVLYFLGGKIYNINYIQYNAVKRFLDKKENIYMQRKKNWQILKARLNPSVYKIPQPYYNTSKYKFIFFINIPDHQIEDFIKYLKIKKINIIKSAHNHIIDSEKNRKLIPKYFSSKNKLCEISTEASIPMENFYNAAYLMNDYFIKKV